MAEDILITFIEELIKNKDQLITLLSRSKRREPGLLYTKL